MKLWLIRTTARLAVVVAVMLVVLWLLVWRPEQQARALVRRQLAQASAQIADLQASTAGLNSGLAAKLATPDAVSMPEPVFGVHTKLVQSVNSVAVIAQKRTRATTEADLAQAAKLSDYQLAVTRALANLEAYDPAADMAGFELGSDDSTQRLARAKDGLAKTEAELAAAGKLYNDASLNEMEQTVEKLQVARDLLAKSGDAEAWVASVQAAQTVVLRNRSAFWKAESGPLEAKLQADLRQAQSVQSLWLQVARSNRL